MGSRSRPSLRARLDKTEDDAGHAERAGERAGQVEVPVALLGLREHPTPDEPDGGTDRDVDEHDPAPRRELGEKPAGDQTRRAAGGGDRRVEADGANPLLTLGEGGRQERERGGCGQGRARALERPGGQERPRRRCQPAEERADRKDGDAEEEDAAATEEVARPGPEKQESAEGEDVGVEHPRQRVRRESEVLLDVGKGDVDDRGVEHDHQLGCEDDGQEQRAMRRATRTSLTCDFGSPGPEATETWARTEKGCVGH